MIIPHMSKKERVITILLAILLLASLIITACSMNEIRKLKFRLDRADYDLLFSINLVASDLFATEIPSNSDETLTRYLTNTYSHLAECSILFPISSYADNSSLYDALKLLEEYLERIQESGALVNDELGLDIYDAIHYMCDDLDSQERAGRVVELLEECLGMAGA